MEKDLDIIKHEPYNLIWSCLKHGSEQGISREQMCLRTGLKDRDLRKSIEKLRLNGAVICSDKNGYFLPANQYELAAYIHQETERAQSNLQKIKAAQELYAQWAVDTL